jgi:hypothetical protein
MFGVRVWQLKKLESESRQALCALALPLRSVYRFVGHDMQSRSLQSVKILRVLFFVFFAHAVVAAAL